MYKIENDKNYRIAVIIPAYNAEKYIVNCIKSVINQTYSNWEIYIVDDGSNDKTSAIAREYSENNSSIHFISKENGGVFKARRIGIDMVQGCELLTFLDSDDYFVDNSLFEKCINEICKYDDDCVCFNYTSNGHPGFSYNERYTWNEKDLLISSLLTRDKIDGNMPYAIYKTCLIKKYFAVYDYNNDDFFNKYNILLHSKKVVYLPIIGYGYNYNPESQTRRTIREIDILFYEHAKQFTINIKETYPNLVQECDYFECWVLLWLVSQLKMSGKLKKLSIYIPLMREFKKRKFVYMNSLYFTRREKLVYMLINLGVFRFVNIIYVYLKRFK